MEEFTLDPSYEFDPYDLWKQVDGVSDDFTLLDLVRIVYAAEADHPGFAASFGMPCLDAFYEEVIRDRDPDDDSKITHLELYWTFDYDVERIKKVRRWNRNRPKGKRRRSATRETPGRGDMRNLMCFRGIGKHWDDPHIDCDRATCKHHNAYGVILTPLNNLAHLPIRVDTTCRIHRPWKETYRHPIRRAAARLGRLGAPVVRWWDARGDNPIMTIGIHPTLHTLISSVFLELTFSGPHPADRNAQLEDLKKSCEDAKEASERGELISMDDMLDELDERLDEDGSEV